MIGQKVEFDGFTGTLIYIFGIEKFGVLLENHTVEFVQSATSTKNYLEWLEGQK